MAPCISLTSRRALHAAGKDDAPAGCLATRTRRRRIRIAPGEPGDPNRALSVWYLVTFFVEDVGAGEADTVYDVAPRIRGRGKGVVCPRDGRPGAAYVDVAEDPNAGLANYLLSYTWAYRVRDIVNALEVFCRRGKLDPKETRFWICCLNVNQSRVMERQLRGTKVPFADFRDTFAERVKQIRNVVALLTPWDNPENLKRLWCVFEIHYAIQTPGCSLELILPDEQWLAFTKFVKQRHDPANSEADVLLMLDVLKKFSQVRVENAVASYQDDQRNIMAMIAPGVHMNDRPALRRACAAHNDAVGKRLRLWLAGNCIECVGEFLRSPKELELKKYVISALGRILMMFGHYEEALQLFEAGLVEMSGDTELFSKVLWFGGIMCLLESNLKEKPASLTEVLARFRRIADNGSRWGTPGTLEHARARVGVLLIHHGDAGNDSNLHVFREAAKMFESAGSDTALEYACLLLLIGSTQSRLGRYDEAMATFERAKICFEDKGARFLPCYSYLVTRMSRQLHNEGRHEEAAKLLNAGRRSYRTAGSYMSVLGSHLLRDCSRDLGLDDKTPCTPAVEVFGAGGVKRTFSQRLMRTFSTMHELLRVGWLSRSRHGAATTDLARLRTV